jgi:hypothetical protein
MLPVEMAMHNGLTHMIKNELESGKIIRRRLNCV